MKKLLALAAGVVLGTALLAGCEKKTVTTRTTETEKSSEAPAYAATPETTPMMAETPARTPTPYP